MANLKEIWIENYKPKPAIRIDWDNGRHHRIEIEGTSPHNVMEALMAAALRIEQALHKDKI